MTINKGKLVLRGVNLVTVCFTDRRRDDETFQDALVSSMRIPRVETKGHDDLGRYQELAEVAAPIRLARRRRRPNALGNQRVEIERRWTR